MASYRTTIGGSVSTFGSGLTGIGLLPQFSTDVPTEFKNTLWYIALAGYIINMFGKLLTSIFAADAQELKAVSQRTDDIVAQTNLNTLQIASTKAVVETKMDA